MDKRKICMVTGSRAEYGLLRWLLREIQGDGRLVLQLLVTGMHLAHEFGLTVNEIEADGVKIDEKIESQLASDTYVGMAKSLGLGIIGCTDAFVRLQPDLVVLMGDRYEILAAAQAAALLGIPIAHISGGEVTEGAVDDWIRHAITKASWWHFVAAEPYRDRVMQLGETPERVYDVGAPGLDAIRHLSLLERPALELDLGIPLRKPLFLVTYHPATLGTLAPDSAFQELLFALDRYPDATIVMTKPNADAGGRKLMDMADQWVSRRRAPTRYVASLGHLRYLSIMRQADVVIGNSSSGITEAPALRVASVNLGTRQAGRLRATSIIDCEERSESVCDAIDRALSDEFRRNLPNTVSKYGDGNASKRIKDILVAAEVPRKLTKRFYDLNES